MRERELPPRVGRTQREEDRMPKAAAQTASETVKMEGFEGHYEDLEGGYTVGFETYAQDSDAAELFRGLPDDRCQSPHWGYVAAGRVGFRFADCEEVYEAGDAYYAPAGHTPIYYAGTRVIEFSPTQAFAETVAVVTKNLCAAGVEV
jgi:hypothetical protein